MKVLLPTAELWEAGLKVSNYLLDRANINPSGSGGQESPCNAGDPGVIPGLGRYPGGGNGNPLKYSCLGNAIDRGAYRAAVHGVTESDTFERLMHVRQADPWAAFTIGVCSLGVVCVCCNCLLQILAFETYFKPVKK